MGSKWHFRGPMCTYILSPTPTQRHVHLPIHPHSITPAGAATYRERAVENEMLVVLTPRLVVGIVGRVQLRQQVSHLQPLAHVAVLVHIHGLDTLAVREDDGVVLVLGLALSDDDATGAVPVQALACEANRKDLHHSTGLHTMLVHRLAIGGFVSALACDGGGEVLFGSHALPPAAVHHTPQSMTHMDSAAERTSSWFILSKVPHICSRAGQAHAVDLVHRLLLHVGHVVQVVLVPATHTHGVLGLAQALHFCLLQVGCLRTFSQHVGGRERMSVCAVQQGYAGAAKCAAHDKHVVRANACMQAHA
eukprot:1159548-Pelagomonas_calceolata.AAC.11